MTGIESVKYQDEKIRYHRIMAGYYDDMLKNPDIGHINDDQINEQIAYHARLLVYHKKRRVLLTREPERG